VQLEAVTWGDTDHFSNILANRDNNLVYPIVDSRLRLQFTANSEYLVFIVDQNLVGTDAVVSAVKPPPECS